MDDVSRNPTCAAETINQFEVINAPTYDGEINMSDPRGGAEEIRATMIDVFVR